MAFKKTRILDYMYDPTFMVPTEKDHNKHAREATLASAQLEILPVYKNMFSELTSCPRQTIIMRVPAKMGRYRPVPPQSDGGVLPFMKDIDVSGAHRANFFKMPTITLSTELLKNITYTKHSPAEPPRMYTSKKSKGIQTIYRESSTQTLHWKSQNYIIKDDSDPEILKIKFLNENLPPGMLEVEMIIRARKQRAWEILLPDITDAASVQERRQIIEAIEMDIWAMREIEIQKIQDLRMELLERMLQELLNNTATRTSGKLERISKRLRKEHQSQVTKMKHSKARELRRLHRLNMGISTRYKSEDVIDEHANYKSEIYAPLMRHGQHPKRGHVHITLERFEETLFRSKNTSSLPSWVRKKDIVNAKQIKLPGRRLCIRETKWTEPILKELHNELLNLGKETAIKKCSLLEKRIKPKTLQETLKIQFDPIEAKFSEITEAALILQSIIRGRATQTLIYEGRDRCRELIEELQSTHFLDITQYTEMRQRRIETLGLQRQKQVLWDREANLESALQHVQGHVIGTMFDFLSKELVRIKDERKAHALALMYERERQNREAAEAGRRQAEERRRQEHDEMFKQFNKIHQDTVDLYLQDIITEGIEHVADLDATKYVKLLAAQVEEKAKKPPTNYVEKEEIIASMVSQFLIPEAEKQRLRERTKQYQQKHLRAAHEEIYNKMEKLPKIKDGISESHDQFSFDASDISQDSKVLDYLAEMQLEESLTDYPPAGSPSLISSQTESSTESQHTTIENTDEIPEASNN